MLTGKCSTPFRFGDGDEMISSERIKIPGRIGNSNIIIVAKITDE